MKFSSGYPVLYYPMYKKQVIKVNYVSFYKKGVGFLSSLLSVRLHKGSAWNIRVWGGWRPHYFVHLPGDILCCCYFNFNILHQWCFWCSEIIPTCTRGPCDDRSWTQSYIIQSMCYLSVPHKTYSYLPSEKKLNCRG